MMGRKQKGKWKPPWSTTNTNVFGPFPASLLCFLLFYAKEQHTNSIKTDFSINFKMVGFEPRISSVGSDISANRATTIALSRAHVKKAWRPARKSWRGFEPRLRRQLRHHCSCVQIKSMNWINLFPKKVFSIARAGAEPGIVWFSFIFSYKWCLRPLSYCASP